ncbi:helix-turn-helix domain-containing protein [Streptomyces sp. NPDC059134]|uniref:helix-turn-helix domain-containing protein n=1 Tax=Streptomyces sp. NPDC059134 TaxID=3346738 RepID=UPI0036CB84EC
MKVHESHASRFTVVGNHLAQHRALSLTAIGLATHIQSLPEGSPVDIRTLASKFDEGRDRIAAALRELEAHGYIERRRERARGGRIVSRTISYNHPEVTRARGACAVRRHVMPTRSTPAPVPTPPVPTSPVPTSPVSPPPVRSLSLPTSPVPPPPPAAPPLPEVTTARRPPSPLPRPAASDPECERVAADLLAELRRDAPALLLAERDVLRLAPGVAAWLERGATPDAVRRTLAAGLPPDLRHPAAFLAHRLTALLPPPLPAAPAPTAARRPDPLQNCDTCDRAYRAPEPGDCPGCVAASPARRAVAQEVLALPRRHSRAYMDFCIVGGASGSVAD